LGPDNILGGPKSRPSFHSRALGPGQVLLLRKYISELRACEAPLSVSSRLSVLIHHHSFIQVGSIGIRMEGELENTKFNYFMGNLLKEKSADLYRSKGVLSIHDQVRDTPSWPRSWANSSLLQLYSHTNAWANSHRLGQPHTSLARRATPSSSSRGSTNPSTSGRRRSRGRRASRGSTRWSGSARASTARR
jgi:G3E family GTPase